MPACLPACLRHDYCGVHEDLAAYWPKLRSGGILAGHDYLDAPEVAAKPSPRKQDWSREPAAAAGADMPGML